jgi:hypothetical protein
LLKLPIGEVLSPTASTWQNPDEEIVWQNPDEEIVWQNPDEEVV